MIRCAKRAMCCLLVLLFIAGSATFAGAEPAMWTTEPVNEFSQWFTNNADGYRLMVEADMEADTRFAAVRTVLRGLEHTIEIYPQHFERGAAAFAAFSNRFASDTSAFTVLWSGRIPVAGRYATVLEWYRPPLLHVENDTCYYAAVDVEFRAGEGLSFLFKSTVPFEQFGSKYYTLVLGTLSLVPRTAAAANTPAEALPNPHWNQETRAWFQEHFGPEAGLDWGLFYPSAPEQYTEGFRALEEGVGHKFELLLRYSDFGVPVRELAPAFENAAAEGRTLELTLQTLPKAEGGVMLLDVLNGWYDPYLAEYAQAVAAYGRPVLFRLCNEMNGDWCSYCASLYGRDAELYVKFYRHVYRIFEENGALANTIWVWNPNERSYPDYGWNHALCYYPGDEYVDVVGLTGYNNGTYYASYGERWRSFGEIYDGLYAEYTAQFRQPLMITEFACSDYGGDKSAWVAGMLSHIEDFPAIKAAIWWNNCDYDAYGEPARPYAIDGNEAVIGLFREYFAERD